MKKIIIRITLATILVSMFAFTGSVFAQAEVPPDAPLGAGTVSDEPLYLNHDEMVTALVDLTGLSAEEVEARLADGETATTSPFPRACRRKISMLSCRWVVSECKPLVRVATGALAQRPPPACRCRKEHKTVPV